MEILSKLQAAHILKKAIALKRNEFLKGPDSIDTHIYFIKSGSVKISVFTEGQEQIIRFGYSGDLIVALDSFISGKKSDFAIQAIKRTEVIAADKEDFMAFIYSSQAHMALYNRILEDLILQQIEREKDILIDSPKQRYERVLRRSPELFQLIPSKHIANYLRMTPETFSRLKKS